MYPIPPQSHRPTNYFWILLFCVAAMLLFLVGVLRGLSSRINAGASTAQGVIQSATAAPSVTPLVIVTPSAEPAAAPTAAPPPTATEVTPQELGANPGVYRSRPVIVRGRIFYIGQTGDGKTWVQIVDSNNDYVDASVAGALPPGAVKGADVQITGISAGLTTITATNGKDYSQPYIEPVQKVETVPAG